MVVPGSLFGLIAKCVFMLIRCWFLNTFCGGQDQNMLSQTIMIAIVSGRKYSRTSAWISTIILLLTSSLCSISLMVCRSLMSPSTALFYQVVCVIYNSIWSLHFGSSFCQILMLWFAFAVVPEGSFIVRAHTPMSNLFSCLWFNEVNRFTSRDQLSFAYTFLKLKRMNPGRPFYLNMFKVT